MAAIEIARENADLVSEFLRRELATEAQLSEIGWVSHEKLDLWERAGVLDLGVSGLERLWLQEITWDEAIEKIVHPRGRAGRWIKGFADHLPTGHRDGTGQAKPVHLKRAISNALPQGKRIELPQGAEVTGDYEGGIAAVGNAPDPFGRIARIKRARGGPGKGRISSVYATRERGPNEGPTRDRSITVTAGGSRMGGHYEIPTWMSTKEFSEEATPRDQALKAGLTNLRRKSGSSKTLDPDVKATGEVNGLVTSVDMGDLDEDELHGYGRDRIKRMAAEYRKEAKKARKKGNQKKADQAEANAKDVESGLDDPDALKRHGMTAIGEAGESELYGQRTKGFEGRIKRNLPNVGERITPAAGEPRGANQYSAAEVHFNDSGKVSQKTLIAYAEECTSSPSTCRMYADDEGNYHPSRQALHEDIIDRMLRQHIYDENGKDIGPSDGSTPPLTPPDGAPMLTMSGGGYAAGKTSVVNMMRSPQDGEDRARVNKEHTVIIDPDFIKAMIPEFQATAGDDPEANMRVYQEAWDIAQETIARAQEQGLDVFIDGICDTDSGEVANKVKSFTDNGYVSPKICYMSAPTDVCIERAKARCANATDLDDRRMIPESIMRAVHRDVSATIPNVMDMAKEMGADVRVYDTNQGKNEETDQFRPARLVAHAGMDGKIDFPNDAPGDADERDSFPNSGMAAYQAILGKANESIEGVTDIQGPRRRVWQTGGQTTSVNDDVSQETALALEDALTPAMGQLPLNQRVDPSMSPDQRKLFARSNKLTNWRRKDNAVLTQPTSNLDELQQAGEQKCLPEFKKLLNSVAGDIGAQVHDVDAGVTTDPNGAEHDIKDFGDVGNRITDNMDGNHVIIAPTKSVKRARAKLSAEQHIEDPNVEPDASELRDMVRGTITVPRAQDLPDAVRKTVARLQEQGWTVENGKNRVAGVDTDPDSANFGVPSDLRFGTNGYGDLSLILRGPPGTGPDGPNGEKTQMLAELQINSNPVWWAKEMGPGHHFYELQREIDERSQRDNRQPTEAEQSLSGDLAAAAKPLYSNAYGVAQHGGLVADPHQVVLGTSRRQQEQTTRALNKLRDRTTTMTTGKSKIRRDVEGQVRQTRSAVRDAAGNIVRWVTHAAPAPATA